MRALELESKWDFRDRQSPLTIRHHAVAIYNLKRFVDAGGLLWPYDVRAGSVSGPKSRPGPKGAGWIYNLNSTRGGNSWNPSLEDWLAREIDSPGAVLLERLLTVGLPDVGHREKFAEVMNAQMTRTPQGYAFLGETAPDLVALTRDELRERVRNVLETGRVEASALMGGTWTLLRPPLGRSFVVSDNPVTSRAYHWPEGAANSVPLVVTRERGATIAPQVTWPLTPDGCLELKLGPARWHGERTLSVGELLEINLRTAISADRWVWGNAEGAVRNVHDELTSRGLSPRSPQVGDWPR